MDTKTCTKCGKTFPATEEYFYRLVTVHSGLTARCRTCCIAAVGKRYHAVLKSDPSYKQKQKARVHAHYERNKAIANERARSWEKNNRERRRECDRLRKRSNRATTACYMRLRRKEPAFALLVSHQKRQIQALKAMGAHKQHKFSESLGGTLADVVAHFESLFLPGMSWRNRGVARFGQRRWHSDHVIPLQGRVDGELVFDFSRKEDCAVAWNYKNLCPLWARDNIVKSNRVPHWDDIPSELQAICTPRIRALLQKVKKTA